MGLALRIAEAQLDLNRIRRMRAAALANALDGSGPVGKNISKQPKWRSQRSPEAMFWEFAREMRVSAPIGLLLEENQAAEREKLAADLEPSKNLVALSRYERRALSRRKFAIRDFDAARSYRKALDTDPGS